MSPSGVIIPSGVGEEPPRLAEPGSEERWRQLQQLRRGGIAPAPWIRALASGLIPPEPDLLAALWHRLDQAAVALLLASEAGAEPWPWLEAGRQELPSLTTHPERRAAWLEPLLQRQATAAGKPALAWLQLLGQLRDPRVAARLRQALTPLPEPELAQPLLPLLGLQRQAQDGELLQQLSLRPGPRALRCAALEGLAVGLSSWPAEPLANSLFSLATDLDPALASTAVDLLARLPAGRRPLRQLLRQSLDPSVRARLRRRLPPSPLVLLVHGRQGGVIPAELETLAAELSQRRGAPVVLQALTAAAPEPDPAFWAAARQAGGVSLVPLLLLPGGHVRRDLPAITANWRAQAAALAGAALWPLPFLGSWPAWQRALARTVAAEAAAADGQPLWLHHPLEGALARRYLAHLETVLGCPGLAAPYSAGVAELGLGSPTPVLLLPLTLAANRLSESLNMGARPPLRVLPPLLELPALREVLITALETLP